MRTEKTPRLFARMDCHGVGEDLNHAIRMLAIALSESRQIVFLPPAREDRYVPTQCALPRSVKLSYEQPWHWLAGQSFSTSSILVPSSCQTALYQRQPIAMEAVAQSSSGNATRVLLQHGLNDVASVSRESNNLWRSNIAISKHVPRLFQRQGLLVVPGPRTSFAASPYQHAAVTPAMRPFLRKQGPSATAAAALQAVPPPPPAAAAVAAAVV